MAVSSPTSRPGQKSLAILRWLVRVGASPDAPLALVGGCSERMLRDHVARLAREGYVRRVPMARGDGSLVVATRRGAMRVGEGRFGALRSVAPASWAHQVACAWVAASFQVRGLDWIGPREITDDDGWRARVTYADPAGASRRVMHRPDLGRIRDSGPIAIEVELQRKSRARVRGILEMYARRTLNPDATLASVVYITGNDDVHELVTRTAQRVGLTGRVFRAIALADVIQQTRGTPP